MTVQWKDKWNIGVPEIDAEHRYLIALVSNLIEKFNSNNLEENLPKAFVHLMNYADKHFKNEESLMSAVAYPLLNEQKQQHELLEDETSELAEKFLSGEQSISIETLNFLKKWVIEHVLKEDKKIGVFLAKTKQSYEWGYTPAFSKANSRYFKECSFCNNKWKTFDDLAKDKNKTALNYMTDKNNHFYNLILFNCSCGTTLAMQLIEFVNRSGVPFKLEQRNNNEDRPNYCLNADKSAPCLNKCACRYTAHIMELLK